MKPVVKNAADEEQVKNGEMRERHSLERERRDLMAVMSTIEGRRFMWRLLGTCKTFETAYNPSGAQTAYNCGRQDLGHELMTKIIKSESDLYLLMQQEAYKEQKNNG